MRKNTFRNTDEKMVEKTLVWFFPVSIIIFFISNLIIEIFPDVPEPLRRIINSHDIYSFSGTVRALVYFFISYLTIIPFFIIKTRTYYLVWTPPENALTKRIFLGLLSLLILGGIVISPFLLIIWGGVARGRAGLVHRLLVFSDVGLSLVGAIFLFGITCSAALMIYRIPKFMFPNLYLNKGLNHD